MEDLKNWHLNELAGIYKKGIAIVRERSVKYATEEDPFRNFRFSAQLAGTTVTQGLMNRLGDKISRLTGTLGREGADDEFNDESFDDTIIDLCNYFVILRNWRIVERREREESEAQLNLFEAEEPEEVKESLSLGEKLRKMAGVFVE